MAVNEQALGLKRVLFLAAGVVLTAVACGSPTTGPSPSPSELEYQVLHSFAGGTTDGAGPSSANLVQGSDGAFYGTTYRGGASDVGTVFNVSADGSLFSLLHSFTVREGNPYGGLVHGADGAFYGTTSQGGAAGVGTVFKIMANGSLSILHNFGGGSSDGAYPNAGLVQGKDGALYGTTLSGGASRAGTVFKVSTDGLSFSLLQSLDAETGYSPRAALVQSTDGAFYGTTNQGGASGVGTVFKVSADGSLFSVLHSFATVNGAYPYAGLVQGTDGAFYGTTAGGGASGVGTVFKVSADESSLSLLHSFDPTNGDYPEAGLVQGKDGAFYGTALQGGVVNCHDLGCGTVFRISADGSSFSVLHKFAGGTSDGGAPNASLVQGTDGAFYGTTTQGGASDNGVVFRLSYRP
jgi:uncharacterized repeat protein (TIGR03803 family)